MSSGIMFLLIIGVIYIAFTYLKGPRNADTYRNDPNMRPFNGDTWNEEAPPELPEDDETEMEADEEMEEIGFEADEAEAVQESEAPAAERTESPAVSPAPAAPTPTPAPTPAVPTPTTPTLAVPTPAAISHEAPPAEGVVIDSEVHIDAVMPADTNK